MTTNLSNLSDLVMGKTARNGEDLPHQCCFYLAVLHFNRCFMVPFSFFPNQLLRTFFIAVLLSLLSKCRSIIFASTNWNEKPNDMLVRWPFIGNLMDGGNKRKESNES